MDKAHQMTDKIIEGMEKRLAREYKKANSEVAKKLREYLEKFAAEDKKQRGLLEAGEITAKDYSDWRFRHIMMNKRWSDMRETLAEDLHGVNNIAQNIARGGRADVYALNHNYAVYEMEHGSGIDTGLTLYNRDAVERMIKKDPQMLPPPGKRVSKRIAEGKDIRYNNRQIQSVMTQGILQGESIPELARRLEEVTERNYTAAVRNARTMATGAQNAGRMDAYERAEENGVELVIEWVATLDDRTRHDHRLLHGTRIAVGETFSTPEGKLRFPGDPLGPPGEVYNCRCTTVSYVKGFEAGTVTNSPKMGDLSFEEWQGKREETEPESPFNMESFTDKMEDYVSGGYSLNSLLTEEEKEYIVENSTEYSKPIYRVENARHTADRLDEDELDPEGFTFSGEFRSFSREEDVIKRMLDENSDDYAGMRDPVIFEVVGKKTQFDMSPFTSNYTISDQAECLAGGTFEVVGEDMVKINGEYIRKLRIRQIAPPKKWV